MPRSARFCSLGRVAAPACLLLAAALVLSACTQAFTTAGDVIRIGLIVPLTSGVPAAARSVVEGAELAADAVNADHGVQGRSLAVITVDDRGVPEEAVRLVEQLAGQEVAGIVGPVTDATTIAAAAAAERFRVVLISPGATAVLPYGGHYVFRTAAPAGAQARAIAAHLAGALGIRRIAVILDSNEYGTAVALAFEQAVRDRGAAVTSRRLYRDGDTDFQRHVGGAVGDGAQAVFIAGYPDEGALILQQLRAVAPSIVAAGSDALFSADTVAWAGAAADGLYVPAGFLPDVPLPIVQDFADRYRARFGRAPDQFAAQAYDAVRVLAAALRRTGGDRARVRDAVAGLRRYPGVTGQLAFDRWGDPVRDVIITRLEGGRFRAAGP